MSADTCTITYPLDLVQKMPFYSKMNVILECAISRERVTWFAIRGVPRLDIRENCRDIFGSLSSIAFIYHEARTILYRFEYGSQLSTLNSCSTVKMLLSKSSLWAASVFHERFDKQNQLVSPTSSFY